MQNKLAMWSSEDKARRFNRLLRLIASRSWLQEATRITLTASGAKTPGVDGVERDMFRQQLPQRLEVIRTQLLNGTYQPQPARRIYIPKANGKQRPLGIPTLTDRIVQRAILMVLEPIWESDFHSQSYGFRLERSVHHAIRTVKFQLQDGAPGCEAGRWVVEGDLSSYYDTVHHRLLMKSLRKRISDNRLLDLIWQFVKAGHIEKNLFCAAHFGVPQGGVLSPLLSNIMLNEFDQWLETKYLSKKARKDRWAWNFGIQEKRSIAIKENRQWKPAVAYCRYADDFVLVIKGTKQHAETIREECRAFLKDQLCLTLNMDKTRVTHVDDGFVFLGHRIIRKRGPRDNMRPVSTIPRDKYRKFGTELTKILSGNYSENRIDLLKSLNLKIAGWANFYQYTDYTAMVYRKIDRIVFWKLAHWLGTKYRTSINQLVKKWVRIPKAGKAKIWILDGLNKQGNYESVVLQRLVASRKGQFRYLSPKTNPYIIYKENRRTVISRYNEIAMAMSHS
jgi:RNA-directed DNA polymerase